VMHGCPPIHLRCLNAAMIVAATANHRMARPPKRRVPSHWREEPPRHWRETEPSHRKERGQKVSLMPETLKQILSTLPSNDGRQPQLLKPTEKSMSIDVDSLTTHSIASMSTSMSSASSASARRWFAAAVCTPKDDRKLPMVMCSPPGMLGKGRYVIRLLRASLKQQFGIAFDVMKARNGGLEALIVSKDLPHLGIRKLDWLQSINGAAPRNLLRCRSMLQEAHSIVLVLQPWDPKALESPSTIMTGTDMDAIRAVDQPLLCLSQAVVTDSQKGEFRVALHRSSLSLPFSMPDWSQNAECKLAEDFPHLAVQTGDRLVSVNGVRTVRKKLCEKLLATALSVDLVFRRDPNTHQPPKHYMQPLDAMGAALRKQTSVRTGPRRRNAMLSHSNKPVWRHSVPVTPRTHARGLPPVGHKYRVTQSGA